MRQMEQLRTKEEARTTATNSDADSEAESHDGPDGDGSERPTKKRKVSHRLATLWTRFRQSIVLNSGIHRLIEHTHGRNMEDFNSL